MRFMAPYALAWFVLALPIVVFYILRVRLKRQLVPTLMFWQQAFEERRLTAWWKQLRHLLSLLLQLMFLSFLVLAMGRPLMPWEEQRRHQWVFVIDNSASMKTLEPGGTRFEHAVRAAQRLLRRVPEEDPVALVVTAPTPHVLCPLTTDRRMTFQQLEQAEPTDAPSRLLEAIEMARQIAGERRRVVVFSDGCAKEAERLEPAEDLFLYPVGRPRENVGIVAFAARRGLVDHATVYVLLRVKNYSDEPYQGQLVVKFDDAPLDVLPLELEPGQEWEQTTSYVLREGGTLHAQLEPGDALNVDDQAWAVVEPLRNLPVVLYGVPNQFLSAVFEAMDQVTVLYGAEEPPAEALLVYHRNVPEALPANPTIVIDPRSDSEAWQVGSPQHGVLVGDVLSDHPLMANVRLDQAVLNEVRSVVPQGAATVLARTVNGEPVYVLVERPGGDVVVLGANLEESDLPLRTAFPIMMANAVAWLTVQGDVASTVATGEVATVAVPQEDAGPLQAYGPDGAELPVVVDRLRRGQFGPLPLAGLWRVENRKGKVVGIIAAAVQAPEEQDLRKTWRDVPQPTFRMSVLAKASWFYLVLLAVGLSAVEWYLYQRRWIA